MTQFTSLNQFNIPPYNAEYIGIYKDGVKVSKISLENTKPTHSTKLYSFGLLSDVHNQKHAIIADDLDFQNALTVLNEKEVVDFICICGDITQNGTETELNNYKTNVDTYSPNIRVYTTTGNHDCPGFDATRWESYVGTPKSFSFTHTIGQTNDLFVFLGMYKNSLGSDSCTPYTDEDLDWLENILEENKNKRVFVITHLFFPTKAGNFNEIYPPANWLAGPQLNRLLAMNEKYLNSIWMSGHSHWMWHLQELADTINGTPNADRANIYRSFDANGKPTCGWTVHVPSCASPIDSTGSNRDNGDLADACSEGAVVDVYEDYIVIRGMSFKDKSDTTYTLKYLPIATYKLDTTIVTVSTESTEEPENPEVPEEPEIPTPTGPYVTAADCTFNTTKVTGCSVIQDEDYVVFNFTAPKQGFYVKPSNHDSTKTCVLRVVDVIYESPAEWSDALKALVGFYTGTEYVTTDNVELKNSAKGVEFNTKSSFSSPSFPSEGIRIKIKCILEYK